MTSPVSQLWTVMSYSDIPKNKNIIISATLLQGGGEGEEEREGGRVGDGERVQSEEGGKERERYIALPR